MNRVRVLLLLGEVALVISHATQRLYAVNRWMLSPVPFGSPLVEDGWCWIDSRMVIRDVSLEAWRPD